MSIASTIAVSGINVASLRLQVSASNVANSLTSGYVPKQVVQVDTGQGVAATVEPVSQALVPAYTPKGPDGDARSFATSPYVDLTNEMVQQLIARFDLNANVHTFRADVRMSEALLDIFA